MTTPRCFRVGRMIEEQKCLFTCSCWSRLPSWNVTSACRAGCWRDIRWMTSAWCDVMKNKAARRSLPLSIIHSSRARINQSINQSKTRGGNLINVRVSNGLRHGLVIRYQCMKGSGRDDLVCSFEVGVFAELAPHLICWEAGPKRQSSYGNHHSLLRQMAA